MLDKAFKNSMLAAVALFLEYPGLYMTNVYILLGVGGYLFVAGLVGMIGSCKEHRGTLIAFTVLSTFGFLAICAYTLIFTLTGVFRDHEYQPNIRHSYGMNGYEQFTAAWDYIQVKGECCGLRFSLKDYIDSNFSAATGNSVPWSCCVMKEPLVIDETNVKDIVKCQSEAAAIQGSPMINLPDPHVNKIGCIITDYFAESLTIFIILYILIGFQFIAMCLAGCVRSKAKETDRKVAPTQPAPGSRGQQTGEYRPAGVQTISHTIGQVDQPSLAGRIVRAMVLE